MIFLGQELSPRATYNTYQQVQFAAKTTIKHLLMWTTHVSFSQMSRPDHRARLRQLFLHLITEDEEVLQEDLAPCAGESTL